MKRIFMCLILVLTLIVNIYFVFYWNTKQEDIDKEITSKEVASYKKN